MVLAFSLASSVVAAASPAAIAPVQLFELDKQITSNHKVFCIGSDKTGTVSLQNIFNALPGGWNSCHNVCANRQWWKESRAHDGSSPAWQGSRAYMDNGDMADFQWLDRTFESARFVLNQRKLKDWVLSRWDMISQFRVNAHCTPTGTIKDCPYGIQDTAPFAHTTEVNNDADAIRNWVLDVAASQENITSYFKQPGRSGRFVAVDLVDGDHADTLTRLMWAIRVDTTRYGPDSPSHLYTLDEPFPAATKAHFKQVVDRSGISIPDGNARAHSDEASKRVVAILEELGCGDMLDFLWYGPCANAIRKGR